MIEAPALPYDHHVLAFTTDLLGSPTGLDARADWSSTDRDTALTDAGYALDAATFAGGTPHADISPPPDAVWMPSPTTPRYIGTGRVLLDAKGNPVKQYEPYFTDTSDCEPDATAATQAHPHPTLRRGSSRCALTGGALRCIASWARSQEGSVHCTRLTTRRRSTAGCAQGSGTREPP